MIYYAIKMIYYVFKWFIRQLVDKYIIYVAIKRKLLWYRLIVSTGTKGFFVKKKGALGGSRTQAPALKTSWVTIALFRDFKHYRATNLDKAKEALGTGLFSSPGAKVYFISRLLGS